MIRSVVLLNENTAGELPPPPRNKKPTCRLEVPARRKGSWVSFLSDEDSRLAPRVSLSRINIADRSDQSSPFFRVSKIDEKSQFVMMFFGKPGEMFAGLGRSK